MFLVWDLRRTSVVEGSLEQSRCKSQAFNRPMRSVQAELELVAQ